MILQIIFWVIVALITFKVWMKLVRLMEIKEEQLSNERVRTLEAIHQGATLNQILEELKGGIKDGKKNRNTRR